MIGKKTFLIGTFNPAGQRHGKGEGLIFSLSDGSHSTAQHGFYIGGWKNNMRFDSFTEDNASCKH